MTDDKIKTITVNNREYRIYSLQAPDGRQDISRLPYSLKILLENLLRHEDGINITRADITALVDWGFQGKTGTRDLLYPGPGIDAGLYRRPGRG